MHLTYFSSADIKNCVYFLPWTKKGYTPFSTSRLFVGDVLVSQDYNWHI